MTRKGQFGLDASESDVLCNPRLDPVARADLDYHLAAYAYDANPRRTKAQEMKLLKARSRLRLACGMHKSEDTTRG